MLYFLLSVTVFVQNALSTIIDRPESLPKGWIELYRSNLTNAISLAFAIKNQNLDKLEEVLFAVSTPGNPQYGNFRDVHAMQDMIAPKESSIRNVLRWLLKTFTNEEIIHQTSTSDLLTVKTTIAVAEKLLNCKYYDYTSSAGGQTHRVSRVRMGTDYNVPSSVKNDLYFVSPTHRFPLLSRPSSRKLSSVTDNEQTPTTLRALYNLGSVAGISSNNLQGVASFRTNYYKMSDVQLIWSKYGITASIITNVPNDERFVSSGAALEAELDVQYITSMGQGIHTQVWWTKGLDFENAMLEWTVNVLASVSNGSTPLLFSVSYGGWESTFGLAYVTKLNTQFALMGTVGISVLVASGDEGAGNGCTGVNDPFQPDYPSCSPYVTAVGGVYGGTAGDQPLGEHAWIGGGGGFSNYASTQSWQASAVAYYLANENSLPDSYRYNSSGRGSPDISAQSLDYLIYRDGIVEAVEGTSCSTPTSGGIFALLNDLRLQNGMSQMGFLNPFIYQTAKENSTAFNDCTSGYNEGCGDTKGFPAAAKWDPATGYGSPNYEVLADYVLLTGKQTRKWVKKNEN